MEDPEDPEDLEDLVALEGPLSNAGPLFVTFGRITTTVNTAMDANFCTHSPKTTNSAVVHHGATFRLLAAPQEGVSHLLGRIFHLVVALGCLLAEEGIVQSFGIMMYLRVNSGTNTKCLADNFRLLDKGGTEA